MILIDYHGDKKYPFLGEIGLLYIYLYGMGYDLWGRYRLYYLPSIKLNFDLKIIHNIPTIKRFELLN